MANFGVNLEEVWHMNTLLPPTPSTSKRSKYEVEVGKEGTINTNDNVQPVYQPSLVLRDNFIPISTQQVPPRKLIETMEVQNTNNSEPIPSSQSKPQPNIDFISEYKKEIHYLRSLVQNLKKELHQKQQTHQSTDKKKSMRNVLAFVFIAVFLIIIIIILSQITQKLNRLLSQPLLFNV
jgi:hypothetical protein